MHNHSARSALFVIPDCDYLHTSPRRHCLIVNSLASFAFVDTAKNKVGKSVTTKKPSGDAGGGGGGGGDGGDGGEKDDDDDADDDDDDDSSDSGVSSMNYSAGLVTTGVILTYGTFRW